MIATLSSFIEWPNRRRNLTFISTLVSREGENLSNIEILSEETLNFFRKLYSKPLGVSWSPIAREGADWLDHPFTKEEVRLVVFQLNKEKAPDLDGFTIAVYQECWDVIKEDLMRVFLEFHSNGIINQNMNATFNSLR